MEKKAKTAVLAKRRRQGRAARTSLGSARAVNEAALFADLRSLVHGAHERVASVAKYAQTMLYWHVGRRLLKEDLREGRGAHGKRIIATVSQELQAEFGEGFSYSALTRMVRFAESMTDELIVATLSQQLSWSHFQVLLPIHGISMRRCE
jgi:DUF1016 N-terminal domain